MQLRFMRIPAATTTCCKVQEAQATVTQDDQEQRAADEAGKLAQPLVQPLAQHSGDADGEQAAPEQDADAAGGGEQGAVSPEQAAAGQGVSIDTSTDVSAAAPAVTALCLQAGRTLTDRPLSSP
jgi:hypothetical protein